MTLTNREAAMTGGAFLNRCGGQVLFYVMQARVDGRPSV